MAKRSTEAADQAESLSSQNMGRLRFELRTNRLKAECSTAELTTRPDARRLGVARWATL